MVVKAKTYLTFFIKVLLSLLFLLTACKYDVGLNSNMIVNQPIDSIFINKKYAYQSPMLQIINMGNNTHLVRSFTIREPQKIQIYAVGETLFGMSQSDKRFLLKSDDINLHIGKLHINLFKGMQKSLLNKRNIALSFSIKDPELLCEVQIPWSNLGIKKPTYDMEIGFNVTVGDNDNGYFQKSVIAWRANTNHESGKLKLSRRINQNFNDRCIFSINNTIKVDGKIGKEWLKNKEVALKEVVHGKVKDSLDLSSSIRSSWDDKYLYFLIRVTDLNFKWIKDEERKNRNTFVDQGYIKDEKGNIVWEMNAITSLHAGGAYKNQKTDTSLYLLPGRYTVSYITDESHSFMHWDSLPPSTPFYGIVLYDN